MKQSLFVSDIALYDVANTAGVAADLSHIETRAKVTGHSGPDNLKVALDGAKLVLIPAGVPRKPGVFGLFAATSSVISHGSVCVVKCSLITGCEGTLIVCRLDVCVCVYVSGWRCGSRVCVGRGE